MTTLHTNAPEARKLQTSGISVVVPLYQSEAILPELVSRLEPVLRCSASDFELILVNDCSPDRTWEVMRRLAQEHAWIRPIDLMRNYGQHNALLCGIRAARYELVVTMDDDLQHPPEEIPRLLDYIARSNYDVVYGTAERAPQGFLRNLATFATKVALRNVMGARIARAQRRVAWDAYHDAFTPLEQEGLVRRPIVPVECEHNAHLYYLLPPKLEARTRLIASLRAEGIAASFHYVPLQCTGGPPPGACARSDGSDGRHQRPAGPPAVMDGHHNAGYHPGDRGRSAAGSNDSR